ncbi:CtsR family transcriptional regulator [Gemella sp. zg-570]|uniref:CtsR family transcriptional regulator n=1 Tax=unclassified Gemella TaxID=2624949 RepID=UPI001C0470E1|nr:CtsR family transcriptional regulator [Gemella sp. zg-1178]QWQ38468.1 CtsR family transcriptional regulator [Gemella sp. zg-570]
MNNMTDIIEQYIKQLFLEAKDDYITLKRSNVAEKFDCVPSQLNYVIKTRFTPEHGFIIESKRGGGGFIRITKITLQSDDYIDYLIETIEQVEAKEIDYIKILKILKNEKYIDYFDYEVMNNSLSILQKNTFDTLQLLDDIDILTTKKIKLTMDKNSKEMLLQFLTNIKYSKEKK